MAHRDVTVAQAMNARQMANKKGVGASRWQKALDEKIGGFSTFLDAVRSGRRIVVESDLVVPEGGRIVELPGLRVNQGQEWQAAINAAGPNTPENYNARKVGDLYLPTSTGIKKKDFVLLNFGPKGGSWERALAWGCQYPQLKRSVPRDVFAVGKAKPELHRELGMDPMYLVATTECAFDGGQRACGVWWGGAVREAGLYWVSDFGGACVWFLFSRE
ncbi:MAG: hypothetical protein A3I39_00985 [Candidatus Yanofskybacteria bacterium RIFCSPLOWO2_02_FULL_47_9b]|uniref:Uncharacterized protein n=1 Tax=Candidatus Yanofskybacteria bacterium RIFCSPLOWO2_02_FULL_47_9b TaxID=1802708 RepID=A0A1F8H9N0_9BACT|nr:MAG: hypothetical protein A3I39_00985 [Candidatus Yanofskybacteria bacterium RIFCSPLOWO2_02_FULL_47_9b]